MYLLYSLLFPYNGKINLQDQNPDVQEVKLSDLSGYWALISIELKELENNFREVSFLRQNHWESLDSELFPAR